MFFGDPLQYELLLSEPQKEDVNSCSVLIDTASPNKSYFDLQKRSRYYLLSLLFLCVGLFLLCFDRNNIYYINRVILCSSLDGFL